MKSPQIETADFIPDKSGYSELQVCQSAAGYYVGTMYYDKEDGFWEPGSRDSGYFRTSEEAEKFLKMVIGISNPEQHLRMHPTEIVA